MRVSAELQPEHYQLLAREAREQYRRLPEQAGYVIAQALAAKAQAPTASPSTSHEK